MALKENIWWTRKSRIEAENRLKSCAFHSEVLLVWYSFCSVCVSLYFLKFNSNSQYSEIIWIAFSIAILCLSAIIKNQRFSERAALFKNNYEALNSLYYELNNHKDRESGSLTKEYEQLLNGCENHLQIDFFYARVSVKLYNSSCELPPTIAIWCQVILNTLKKYLILIFLYSLPIVAIYIETLYDS